MTLNTLAARYCPTIDNSADDILSRFDGQYQGGMVTVSDTSHGGTRAYEFDGANDRLEVQRIFTRGYTPPSDEPFSVAFRIKATSPASSQTWMGTYTGSGQGWSIGCYGNVLYVGFYSAESGYSSCRATTPFTSTAWKKIAFTYDGSGDSSGIKIYVDGVLATMTDASESAYTKMTSPAGTLNIGGRSATQFFAGRIDDVMIFKTVLDATEVAAIAAAAPGSLESDVFFATSFENDDHGFTVVSSGGGPGWYRADTPSTLLHEGLYSLSASVAGGSPTKLTTKEITLPRPGTIYFHWRASSPDMDCDFKIDGVTQQTDPPTTWQLITAAIPAGERTLTWTASSTAEFEVESGTVSVDDVYIVLDPPEPVTLDIVGSTSVNVTKGLTGSFTLERSGGDLSESLVVDLASDDTDIATVPATLTFLATETTATIVVTSAGNSGLATITATYTADAAEATLDVSVVTVPTAGLLLDATSERVTVPRRLAKYRLGSTTTRQTLHSSYRATSTKLIVRNARTRGNTVIDLAWSDLADDLPALYRSFFALQLQLPATLIEPIVSAAVTSTGENIPVLIRNRMPELPAKTDRLKLIIQPPRGVVPAGITITISDYTNN